ncbi:10489_t:CDS:1, partial [Acaulospora colombiana]
RSTMRPIPPITGSNREPLGRQRHQEVNQVPNQALQYSLEIDDEALDIR